MIGLFFDVIEIIMKLGFWVSGFNVRWQSYSTWRVQSLGKSQQGTSITCLGLMRVHGEMMQLTPSVWVLMDILSDSSMFILIATHFFSLNKSFKLFLLPGILLHLQGNHHFLPLFFTYYLFILSTILHILKGNKIPVKIKCKVKNNPTMAQWIGFCTRQSWKFLYGHHIHDSFSSESPLFSGWLLRQNFSFTTSQ